MTDTFVGAVDYHPKGSEICICNIYLHPEADYDILLRDTLKQFSASLRHSQTVIKLPVKAQVLAHSEHDPHQIIRYSPSSISFQFHPEVTPALMETFFEYS